MAGRQLRLEWLAEAFNQIILNKDFISPEKKIVASVV
jgi:hypothetical protein